MRLAAYEHIFIDQDRCCDLQQTSAFFNEFHEDSLQTSLLIQKWFAPQRGQVTHFSQLFKLSLEALCNIFVT